jgi:hypothetical protein
MEVLVRLVLSPRSAALDLGAATAQVSLVGRVQVGLAPLRVERERLVKVAQEAMGQVAAAVAVAARAQRAATGHQVGRRLVTAATVEPTHTRVRVEPLAVVAAVDRLALGAPIEDSAARAAAVTVVTDHLQGHLVRPLQAAAVAAAATA